MWHTFKSKPRSRFCSGGKIRNSSIYRLDLLVLDLDLAFSDSESELSFSLDNDLDLCLYGIFG